MKNYTVQFFHGGQGVWKGTGTEKLTDREVARKFFHGSKPDVWRMRRIPYRRGISMNNEFKAGDWVTLLSVLVTNRYDGEETLILAVFSKADHSTH